MYKMLHIGGTYYPVGNILVGSSRSFKAYGYILASGIKRYSKNRYKVYVIWSYDCLVGGLLCSSLKEAVEFLQSYYDKEINK